LKRKSLTWLMRWRMHEPDGPSVMENFEKSIF
jgi:hypothetical protein